MLDHVWKLLRYMLVIIGTFMAARGWFGLTRSDVEPLADALIAVMGSGVAVGGISWSFWISRRAKLVPVAVVEKMDLPVASELTGSAKRQKRRKKAE